MRVDEAGKMVIILWDSPPMTVGNTNVCNKRLEVEINAKTGNDAKSGAFLD